MKKIKRQSNYELLRIVCMLMIIAGHLIIQHKTSYSFTDVDEIIKLFCRSFFSVAVNTFILISGYWGINYKTKRLFSLIMQTIFYSIALLIISIVVGWHSTITYRDVFAFFPILTKRYWFVTCYFILYISSFWLNKILVSLNQKDFKGFLLLGFIVIYVWPTINYLFNAPQFIEDAGYGIVNFIYLYLLGRYLRLFYDDSHSSSYYGGWFVVIMCILFLCQYLLSFLLGFEFTSWLSYNTIFILVGSVLLFLSFKNMHFSFSIINYWAKPCLAVYLIHMNPNTWSHFCQLIRLPSYHGANYLFVIFTLPCIIYFICSIIEIIRMKLIGKLENKAYLSLQKYKNKLIDRW